MNSRVLYILLWVFLTSCQDWQERRETTRLVKEWHGREILLPDSLVFMSLKQDSVSSPDTGLAECKVLTYVEDSDCLNCQLQLSRWMDFIATIDALTTKSVPFLFYVNTSDVIELKRFLKQESFDYPFCVDHEDRLNRLNQFPSSSVFHTFLLDAENRVLVVGSPVDNFKIRDLYLSEIEKSLSVEPVCVALRADCQKVDIGKIRLGQTREICIKLTNEGNSTFMLEKITTSCDCTEAVCSWTEIPSGDTRPLTVRFKAEHAGDFIREITLHGNLSDSFFTVDLCGEVVASRYDNNNQI